MTSLCTLLLLLSACMPKGTDTSSTDVDTTDTTPNPDTADGDGDGYSIDDGDCDDTDATISPGAEEVWYDGIDQDCNRRSDYDADADGHEVIDRGEDCDDTDAAVHPDAEEVCDGIDNNCDGIVDDNATDIGTWYTDADADGYGEPGTATVTCTQPSGTVSDNTDCDDSDSAVHPGADTITCDGVDNDCDPKTAEAGSVDLDGTAMSSIAAALSAADEGSTITLCEGRYEEGSLVAAGTLTITGLGPPAHTIIDAGEAPLLRASGSVTLQNLTLTGGTGTVYDGAAVGGGLLGVDTAELTLSSVIVSGNTAGDGAGIYIGEEGWLSLDDVLIEDNHGDSDETPVPSGGGIHAAEGAVLLLAETTIRSNTAGQGGGVSLETGAMLDGSESTVIHSNEATLNGGGIDAVALNDDPIVVSGVTLLSNEAVAGGGIYCRGLELSDAALLSNLGSINGGGIYAIGDVLASGVELTGNRADFNGGGVYLSTDASATLSDSSVLENSADFASYGGGVFLNGGTLVSERTDWGDKKTDNAPYDLELDEAELTVNIDGVASFTCVDEADASCAP